MKTFTNARNPLLPPSVHIPDGEAHVMPDGKLYVYGSYDAYPDMYCSDKYDVAATADMIRWELYEDVFSGADVPWYHDPEAPVYESREGPVTPFAAKMQATKPKDDMDFVLSESGDTLPPLLFAPDCIEKDGIYYLYFCMADGSEGVAVSDRPEGPFRDPVRLPCGGIDPAVFVDRDGQAYYYWGQFRSHAVPLEADMRSFDPGKVIDAFLTEERHYFHEGSSIRRIGDLYYAVFADVERGRPTALGYATSPSPLGPFTYRGIIIDNCGCDPASWNNHGSIECFHGQWYVFYHRSSRNTKIYRRLCAEKITVLKDGTIPEVRMTSQGAGAPFGPGETIPGFRACMLSGALYIDVLPDRETYTEALVHIRPGDRASFRYIASGQGFSGITLTGSGSGVIEVLADGQAAGTICMRDGKQEAAGILIAPGTHELELCFTEAEGLVMEAITLY
ncbi:MAG: family 43 glycosylhydrolase [Lachnospiraceae bacterium]|nr:family 43 glycosylhydrolase [Lachnospiraceae bacterium]